MAQDSLGKIVCVTPGVPVRATVNRPDPATPFYVHAYSIQRISANKGSSYISLSPTDDRATLEKILGILSSTEPAFSAGIVTEMNGMDMSKVYIDHDNADDAVIISYLLA